METYTVLGPPPSDSRAIRFSDDCFETVGVKVEYLVPLLAPNYPRRFGSLAEAQAFAVARRSHVVESRTPIQRRVRWF